MSGTITLDAVELSEAVLGAVLDNSMNLRDIEADIDLGVPDGAVWLVRNLYISTGTIYISGEVVVCG
jgi:hypothetical protein